MKLIFEKSRPGAGTDYFPEIDEGLRAADEILDETLRRQDDMILPEVSEIEFIRHYSQLARRNVGVDQTFYPLGSCTMKYNPRIHEAVAAHPGFAALHPLAPDTCAQGTLRMLYELKGMLSEITGMDAFTLNPMAGAHGEWTGMYCIRKFHERRGEIDTRTEVLVPDSAHGTNPASAAMCGFRIVKVNSDERGMVSLEDLRKKVSKKTAALMLTNPNTLGIFEENILEIADILHSAGAQLYYDGANLNAIAGIARPGDMGFDVVHLNLHKTFSTPHGGGGPGAGPVGVKDHLRDFLPLPDVREDEDGGYFLETEGKDSIGRIGAFYGNVGVCLRAYVYLRQLGKQGVQDLGRGAVLNAVYLKKKLEDVFAPSHAQPTMHEYVCAPGRDLLDKGVHTMDIAKRLIDHGYHPMTVYFPLVVKEAMMIEPTETETRETLDRFADVLRSIRDEGLSNPDIVKTAPHSAAIRRVDEIKAAKELKLTYVPAK